METDARGASSTYSYNNRHLVTGITYGVPSGVAATPNVTFGYDEAGNRTSMTDGLGSATYHYDTLSRMDWETRVLTGVGVGSFTINYAYNLSGQLTSVTDPVNDSVTYVYNRAGEITAINGSNFGGVTQYVSGLQFRAWGDLKALSYGNGLSLANNFNTRLQLQQMEVKGFVSSGSPSLMKIQHQYYPDGMPKFAQNLIDSRFDRAWANDHVGRLSEAYTGQEADNYAGVSVPVPQTGPYRHTHQYDAWNNLTSRNGRYWTETTNFTTTYNSQNQRQGWTYDSAGNLLNNGAVYDAAGRTVSVGGVTQAFDGQGNVVKRTGLDHHVTYYLYSTPLGGKLLAELFGTTGWATPVGTKMRSYVYAGGAVVAKQLKGGVNYTSSWVEWQHVNHLTGSLAASYNVTTSNGNFAVQRELDPMGANVGLNDPLQVPPAPAPGEVAFLAAGSGFFPDGTCTIDGLVVGCSSVSILLYSGFGSPGSVETPGSSWAGLSLVDRPKPGDWCSTRKDGKIDGIIGTDGKCRKALSGDNSVTIGLGDQRFRRFIMLNPPNWLFTGKIDGFSQRGGGNLDDLQETLDYIGLCPGYGAWADGANAIIYTGKGEFGNAAISGMAVVPILEWAAAYFKWGGKGAQLLPGEGFVGRAGKLQDIGPAGDNLTPHHIPSANHMKQHGVKWDDGIAINMEQPRGPGGRHRDTFTYGTTADANMLPRKALGAGVRDARKIYMNEGLYGPYMRNQLQLLIELNKNCYPQLFKKK